MVDKEILLKVLFYFFYKIIIKIGSFYNILCHYSWELW